MPSKQPDIFVKINIKGGGIEYRYAYYHRTEKNGMHSWYIPGFNMFFSTKTQEAGSVRAAAMVKSFFIDYFEKQDSFRSFILELHRLGFRASSYHDLTINKLLTKKIPTAQLGYVNGHASTEFKNSTSQISEGSLAMAI